MDMNSGEIHQLTVEEAKQLSQQEADKRAFKKMMSMTPEQVKATENMPNRKARRYMLAQPCTCKSGKIAKKCCF